MSNPTRERCPNCDHLLNNHQPVKGYGGCFQDIKAGDGTQEFCPCNLDLEVIQVRAAQSREKGE